MKHARLALARSAEVLPALEGLTCVLGQLSPDRLSGLNIADLRCESASFTQTSTLKASGFQTGDLNDAHYDNAIVLLPRAKAEALHLIARAVSLAPNGWIIVDGQKTDGIESIAKQITRELEIGGSYSKGHGKTIWFQANRAQGLAKWLAQPSTLESGFKTAPGVFSADGIDPASELLLQNLPLDLVGTVCDLGAGWGYLSAELLSRSPKITNLHLVEDNQIALYCAKENVTDARASFHWADALNWAAPESISAIIMNPPFHQGRNATPELGIAFIKSAARLLKPGGELFMVANSHLPYENTLEECFAKSELLARTNRFKVYKAERTRGKLR
ncbi:methyltransferase [Planktotalea sp.]|uniref:class I SAM-dependent methyltransferase n=1 Tax=Planktotalea sp. TaxID=2029877 RepID=UPI003D6C5A2C